MIPGVGVGRRRIFSNRQQPGPRAKQTYSHFNITAAPVLRCHMKDLSAAKQCVTLSTCMHADFSSLLPKGDKVYQITHFEDPKPAASYFSQLQQDSATGNLTALSTQCAPY